jgi:hypothetical protein
VSARVVFAEMLAEVPVTVTVAVPVVAALPAVNARVLVELALAGLNAAVTPVGNPAIARLTAPVKPFAGVTVTVLVPDAPRPTVRLAGAAASVKLGATAIVKAMAVFAETPPDVAVTVAVAAPTVAEAPALSVSVLVELVLTGLNAAVTPLGNPAIDRLTGPVKPNAGVTAMVLVPTVPWMRLKLAGAAASVTPGAATVTFKVGRAEMRPYVPVMVAAAVASGAAAAAVSVRVLVEVVLAGLNTAVTPLGKPAIERLTAPVKPFSGVKVTVLVADIPCPTLTLAGDAASEKVGAASVRTKVALAEMLPDVPAAVPVTVNVVVPSGAELPAVSVSVLVDVALAGLNAAVTPVGNPAITKLTAPVNPFAGFTMSALVTDVPCPMLKVAGASVRVKLGGGGGVTVTAIVRDPVRLPEVPLMVTWDAPCAAQLDAVRVRVLVEVVLAGLKDAVTPEGKPDAANVAVPPKPPSG